MPCDGGDCSRIREYHSTQMRRSSLRLLPLFLLLATVSACQRKADNAAPLVTPTVSLAKGDAAVGSPIEMTYGFAVAPDAKFNDNYWVFVPFLDGDRELMWTDDHKPPVPT